MSTKWEMIITFSLMIGIMFVFVGSIVLAPFMGPQVKEVDVFKRSNYAEWSGWVLAIGKYLGRKLLNGIQLLVLALAIGFVILLVFTNGAPLDPTLSAGVPSK